MDDEVFREMEAQDWGKVFKRVLFHAECRARKYYWRTGRGFDLAKGWTPEDVVQHVIEKTINGERRWNPKKGPLVPWLRDQVNSVIDALWKSEAGKYEAGFPETEEDDDSMEWLPVAGGQANELGNSPRAEENSISAAERMDELWKAIGDDEEVADYVWALQDGCRPEPRYLAEQLGVSREEIYNRKKRLKTLLLREAGDVRRA